MNPASLTRHLLLKDLRHQRVWLALLWVLALLIPFVVRYASGAESRSMDSSIALATGAFFLLIFIVVARIIRLDAPGREFHYLATRPVSWRMLLSGKILFIALFLLLPALVAEVGVIYMMKIPVNLTDIILLLVENTICSGALLAVVVLFSIFFRTLPVIFFYLIIGTIVAAVGGELLRQRAYHSGVIPGLSNLPLNYSQTLVFYFAGIVTIGAVAIFRYRRKSLFTPLCILAAGLALSLLIRIYWPYDLSRHFPDKPQYTGGLPSPLRDHIKFALRGEEGVGENSLGSYGMWNGIKYVNFNHGVTLEGVQPPYFATVVDYHAEATLKSGRVIRSSYADMDSHGGVGGISEALRQQVAGFPLARQNEWSKTAFEIFSYVPGLYQKEDFTGASIKGVITLEIRKAVIIKTMPFKPGGTVDMPRRRYTLQKAGVNREGAVYQIVTNSVVSTLRGDYQGWGGWENLTWLVFNRAKGECLSPESGGGGGGSPGFFCSIAIFDGTLRRNIETDDWKKENDPFPADWGDNAEISFFTTEPCGRISFPYEIKSVDLAH